MFKIVPKGQIIKSFLKLCDTKNKTRCLTTQFETAKEEEATPYGSLGLSIDEMLSETNRKRTLECLQKVPPISIKRKTQPNSTVKHSAVLIALCTIKSETEGRHKDLYMLFTKRSKNMRRHMRQIVFPGGMRDEDDEDYIDCALRETEEEIGLSPNRIEVWGQGKLIRPPHTAAIMPVVGVIRDLNVGKEVVLNTNEVEEAFTIPIPKLLEPGALNYTQYKSGYSSPVFMVEKYKIWGITGYLLDSFLKCFLNDKFKSPVRFIKPYKAPK